MYAHGITGGPSLGRLIRSLTRFSRCVTFTVPVNRSRIIGGRSGGWIWNGSSDQVEVRITSLERADPPKGRRSAGIDDWHFTGTIDSPYKGTDGTKVRGTYSVATRTGSLERVEKSASPSPATP